MVKENERKFLAKDLPDLTKLKSCKIEQWYLSKPGDLVSTRIRLYDDNRCYLDLKKGIGMERYEKGFKCEFDDLKYFVEDLPKVSKTRYRIDKEDYIIFIDVFDNGFVLIEVEADDVEFLKNYVPEDWFGKDVTDDVKYTNNYMAFN